MQPAMVGEEINLSKRLAPSAARWGRWTGRRAAWLVPAWTLVYLSTHHYQAVENLLHSPLALRKMHGLTAKQFTWVLARARVEAWGDCEKLLVGKGWMEGKKAI